MTMTRSVYGAAYVNYIARTTKYLLLYTVMMSCQKVSRPLLEENPRRNDARRTENENRSIFLEAHQEQNIFFIIISNFKLMDTTASSKKVVEAYR